VLPGTGEIVFVKCFAALPSAQAHKHRHTRTLAHTVKTRKLNKVKSVSCFGIINHFVWQRNN